MTRHAIGGGRMAAASRTAGGRRFPRRYAKAVTLLSWSIVLLLVLVLSLAPLGAENLPEELAGRFNLGHFPAYGLLAALTLRLLHMHCHYLRYGWAVTVTAASTTLTGGMIELLQPLVGRTADPADMAMNMLGIASGLTVMVVIRQRRLRARSRAAR